MAFRVELTTKANQDLAAILEWLLANDAGETGLHWFQKMRKAMGTLGELPGRCASAPENGEFPFEVRQLLYGRKPHQYRILFTIDEDCVIVLHIGTVTGVGYLGARADGVSLSSTGSRGIINRLKRFNKPSTRQYEGLFQPLP